MQQAPPQQQVPSRIQIGQPHKKQKVLSDEQQLTKEGGLQKINAIKVFTNDKYVIGMTFYYKLADGDYLKASHNVPAEKKLLKKSNKIQSRVFEIGPDDYLLEIAGHYSKDKITRITFTSYRGKVGNYGTDEGNPFSYKFQNYTFGPFNSGFRDALEFLDVPVLPVPQSFLNEFRPITVNVNVSNQEKRDKQQAYKPVNNAYTPPPGAGNGGVPIFQGAYVSRSATSSQVGQVKQPVFQMPQVQQQYRPQQQQQFQQAPPQYQQQQYQAPPQQQQQQYQPPQQQQAKPQNNNVMSSKYPEF